MPLLKGIGLVAIFLLLGAIIGIMPSLVALEAFHLTNVPFLGGIIISAIVVAIVVAICPGGSMVVVVLVAIMVMAVPLVMLMPISTIMVVVVSSMLVGSRASMVTVIAAFVRRLWVLADMVLPLPVFRLFNLAFQSYGLVKQ
jgi:hypothetical protein